MFDESGEGWSLWRAGDRCELRDDQQEVLWQGMDVRVLQTGNGRVWLRNTDYHSQETLADPFGSTQWSADKPFLYADSELAVVGDWMTYGTGTALIDQTGAVRSQGYVSVAADPRSQTDAQFFLAVREDAVDKLDRQGQVVGDANDPRDSDDPANGGRTVQVYRL